MLELTTAVIVLVLVGWWGQYSLAKMRRDCDLSWVAFEQQIQARYDWVPQWVQIARPLFQKTEVQPMVDAIEARQTAIRHFKSCHHQTEYNQYMRAWLESELAFTQCLQVMRGFVRQHPQLQIHPDLTELKAKLIEIETRMLEGGSRYNAKAEHYNCFCRRLPMSFVAKAFGHTRPCVVLPLERLRIFNDDELGWAATASQSKKMEMASSFKP